MPGLEIEHPTAATDAFPPDAFSPGEVSALRPSEYTALLIQALRARPELVAGRDVLEIGTGSATVLAAIGEMQAQSLCGVDVEQVAIAFGRRLLDRQGYRGRTTLHCGDMWQPLAGQRFDLIVANLPQFPMETSSHSGRLPSWSSGGKDGRRLLDRFLAGLATHLTPGGRALITHNGFIDLHRTSNLLSQDGLSLRVVVTMLVPLPAEKLDLMTRETLLAQLGRSIYTFGPYAFADLHIVKSEWTSILDNIRLWRICLFVVSLVAVVPSAASAALPDGALEQLLQSARTAAQGPGACTRPNTDRLIRVICAGSIRVGVRDDYPLFGSMTGDARSGYEISVVNEIARRLGVAVEFVKVKPANRIPMLADDHIDFVIATMGDTVQRESQARFIKPPYYQSETLIVGPQDRPIAGWEEMRGRTVCVTVGNGSNAELLSRGARVMLFDDPVALPARLADQTCSLAAQDNSFFASYFAEPEFGAGFSGKFGFAGVPWGMAVARTESELLARALDLISQIFHRDGVFLAAGAANRIDLGFLKRQQALWSSPACNVDDSATQPECLIPPANAELAPTSFAGSVGVFERWVLSATGFELLLPMFKTQPAWILFINGVTNSLILVAGALAMTLVSALLLGAATASRWHLVNWPARLLTIALQSSPIVLTLVITEGISRALVPYSTTVGLIAAIVALGLTNGSNAGQAIMEAYISLRTEAGRAEAGEGELDHAALFMRAIRRAATQIVAFLVNAAKGTPIASFIGAPELLSALTDITSFASGRATTYTLLLIFYTAIIMCVVFICRWLQRILARGPIAPGGVITQ